MRLTDAVSPDTLPAWFFLAFVSIAYLLGYRRGWRSGWAGGERAGFEKGVDRERVSWMQWLKREQARKEP